MRYSKFMEIWGESDLPLEDLVKLHLEEVGLRMAWKVLWLWESKKGFEYFWHDIDDDIKDEVFNDLANLFRPDHKELEPND